MLDILNTYRNNITAMFQNCFINDTALRHPSGTGHTSYIDAHDCNETYGAVSINIHNDYMPDNSTKNNTIDIIREGFGYFCRSIDVTDVQADDYTNYTRISFSNCTQPSQQEDQDNSIRFYVIVGVAVGSAIVGSAIFLASVPKIYQNYQQKQERERAIPMSSIDDVSVRNSTRSSENSV